ncbi:MAG: type II secretion system F family protein [Acetatifactor sp.]|nr:type II secretion system F family protein [Acetatifactor sp.]
MKILILIFLAAGFFLLFYEMGALRYLAGTLRRTREGVDAAARQRSLADRQRLLDLQEEHSFWYFLEQQLQYSGIRRRFPGMTAEWFLAGNLAGMAVLFLVSGLAGGLTAASAAVLLYGTGEWFVLKKLRERNFRRTEENLMKLLDFLGNYSVTGGEITGILGQVSRYVEEPVKSALDMCCYEASTTGDIGMALRFMAERIEHPKFRELARNMEISVRYCADLSALVESSRRSLREYLRVAQERRAMLREALIHLALLAGMSAVVLLMVERLTGIGLGLLLTGTWPGRVGLAALVLLFVFFWSQMHSGD